jgi:hypothetical protein
MIRIATLIAASLLATSAFAADRIATLNGQQGTVLVNQSEEFVTAAESQALLAGDRVMVMEGGSALVTFTDGCVLALEAGSLLEVPALSTCSGAVANVQTIGPSYAQAVGAPVARSERNRNAWWIFGGWTAGIAYALIDNNYRLYPPSP